MRKYISYTVKCIAAVLAVMALLSAAPENRKVKLVLHRPYEVGQEFSFDYAARDVMTLKINDGVNEVTRMDVDCTVELAGTFAVREINRAGVKRADYKVESAVFTKNGKRQVPYPTGTVITAFRDEKGLVHLVNGNKVPKDEQDILSLLSLAGKGQFTDDELIGTAAEVRPGDAWEVNRENFKKLMGKPDASGKEAAVKGTVRFKSISRKTGIECAVLDTALIIDNAPFPYPMPFREITQSRIETESTDRFPLDPAVHSTDSDFHKTWAMTAAIADDSPRYPGQTMTMHNSFTIRRLCARMGQ